MEWLLGIFCNFGRFRASPGEFFLSASQGEVLREQSAELLMAQHWFNKTRDKCFVPASRRRRRAHRKRKAALHHWMRVLRHSMCICLWLRARSLCFCESAVCVRAAWLACGMSIARQMLYQAAAGRFAPHNCSRSRFSRELIDFACRRTTTTHTYTIAGRGRSCAGCILCASTQE